MPDIEPLPVLAGAESKQALRIDTDLPHGTYSVKYRVDFQDGGKAIEGVTDVIVAAPVPKIASSGTMPKKP